MGRVFGLSMVSRLPSAENPDEKKQRPVRDLSCRSRTDLRGHRRARGSVLRRHAVGGSARKPAGEIRSERGTPSHLCNQGAGRQLVRSCPMAERRRGLYHPRALDGRSRGEGYRPLDRKSTRLNSSHLVISYAVFCLKKKKKAE